MFLSFWSFSFMFVLLKFLKTCCNSLLTSNDFCASEDVQLVNPKTLQRHRSLLLYEAGVFEISVKYWLVLSCNRFLFPKNFIGHHAIQSVRLLPLTIVEGKMNRSVVGMKILMKKLVKGWRLMIRRMRNRRIVFWLSFRWNSEKGRLQWLQEWHEWQGWQGWQEWHEGGQWQKGQEWQEWQEGSMRPHENSETSSQWYWSLVTFILSFFSVCGIQFLGF